MKCVFNRIIAAFSVMFLLGACSSEPNPIEADGSVRVLSVKSDSSGSYSLDVLTLHSLHDLSTMAGRFANFFWSPRIVDKRLNGQAPRARFIRNAEGEQIPSDEITQQLVTIYYHMQKLAALDEEMGVGGVNKWPRDIGVGVRAQGTLVNNAFYDGVTDSMLFVPYTQQHIPIAVNAGILAHEHFHSLFYKMVMPDSLYRVSLHDREEFLHVAGITEVLKEPRQRLDILPEPPGVEELGEKNLHFYYHLSFLRGLNEGMADFWGWMYTGDPDFLAQSLPSEKANRSLKAQEFDNYMTSSESLQRAFKTFYGALSPSLSEKDKLKQLRSFAVGRAYTLASQQARFLKQFADLHGKERGLSEMQARKAVGKMVLSLLPKIKEDFAELGESFYSPEQVLVEVTEQLGASMTKKECDFIAKVMRNSSEEADIQFVCTQEESWKIKKEKVENKNQSTSTLEVIPSPSQKDLVQ